MITFSQKERQVVRIHLEPRKTISAYTSSQASSAAKFAEFPFHAIGGIRSESVAERIGGSHKVRIKGVA
jgi:hypothetical protein